MKIIVVDDIRLSADKRAVHAENTDEAIALLTECMQKGEIIDELWLDYDMSSNRGIGEQTNVPVANWLIANQQSRTPLVIKQIIVHSRHHNAKNLVEMLDSYFNIYLGELPDNMWWEQPEEVDEDQPSTTTVAKQ
jgi:hypothetical protein